MTPKTLHDKAICVLAGAHGYQYISADYGRLFDALKSNEFNSAGGRLIHVDGMPGCGVSTLMNTVDYSLREMTVSIRCELSTSMLTLLDQFANALQLRSPNEQLDSIPQYLHAYVRRAGIKLVIVDDLERFVVKSDNFRTTIIHLQSIAECGNGLIVLYSTRDTKLQNLMRTKGDIKPLRFYLSGGLKIQEVVDIAKGLFAAANKATNQNIKICEFSLLKFMDEPMQIDEVVSLLESTYAHATLNRLKEINLNDYFCGLLSGDEPYSENLQAFKRSAL